MEIMEIMGKGVTKTRYLLGQIHTSISKNFLRQKPSSQIHEIRRCIKLMGRSILQNSTDLDE